MFDTLEKENNYFLFYITQNMSRQKHRVDKSTFI